MWADDATDGRTDGSEGSAVWTVECLFGFDHFFSSLEIKIRKKMSKDNTFNDGNEETVSQSVSQSEKHSLFLSLCNEMSTSACAV